ncbi:Spy/CpxP family protein refolding chaperone [Dongia deserti]|uniref:Spy/CpxP family protein refolding chaperone n=1 Tax=Dongia deserti TaxID=2268030 RepID=UPI000E64F6A1|nr:Spy/CpxP family protein refolding chaperone [Dongia deserti]
MIRFALLALALIAMPAIADTTHHGQHSPYAGLHARDIKALSPEQIADLKAGRGMGLALAAELNGYPGPRHVLDLAQELALTSDQHQRTSALFEAMRQETSALGERLIEAERALDRLFAEQRATPQSVVAATLSAGTIEGELRAAHLRYHLAMMDILTPEQIQTYNRVRGYAHH